MKTLIDEIQGHKASIYGEKETFFNILNQSMKDKKSKKTVNILANQLGIEASPGERNNTDEFQSARKHDDSCIELKA